MVREELMLKAIWLIVPIPLFVGWRKMRKIEKFREIVWFVGEKVQKVQNWHVVYSISISISNHIGTR